MWIVLDKRLWFPDPRRALTIGSLNGFVALGGDTDTNGAVTGALLGAIHGRAALPPVWLRVLLDRVAIEEEAEALANTATA